MTRLSTTTIRIISAVVAIAVVAGIVVYLVSGGPTRTVSAQFSSGTGIYNGTPVKILGVPVGSVVKVTPESGDVRIEMHYNAKYVIPSDAIAVTIANSLVSDRYIQLQWQPSDKNPRLPDGATIPIGRTASPAELDDIYSALNKLNVSLGPTGANKNGALSDLVNVGAANLQGNGENLGASFTALSKAITTLSNGRGDLFSTVKNLQTFGAALTQSDSQVRQFEQLLAQVSGELAGERGDLGAALHNLGNALDIVSNFIQTNSGKLHTDILGLESLTNVLVKDQGALNETLSIVPVAASNITHAYQEASGTLGTRSNLGGLTDPVLQICSLVNTAAQGGLVGVLLGTLNLPALLTGFCKTHAASATTSSATNSASGTANSNTPIGNILQNGLNIPGLPTGGTR